MIKVFDIELFVFFFQKCPPHGSATPALWTDFHFYTDSIVLKVSTYLHLLLPALEYYFIQSEDSLKYLCH